MRTAELAEGTTIETKLLTGLDSSRAQSGEWFSAEVVSPVMYGQYTLIPAGSKVHGVVDEAAQPALKLAQPATVRIAFDRIETPDGRVIAVHAGLRKDVDAAKAINKLGGSVGTHLGEQELRGGRTGGVFLPLKIARAARKGEEFMNKDANVVIPAGTPLTLVLKDTTPVPLDAATSAGISDSEWTKAGEEYHAQMKSQAEPVKLRGALRQQIRTIRQPVVEERRGILRRAVGAE
jgi:hypothetical protein